MGHGREQGFRVPAARLPVQQDGEFAAHLVQHIRQGVHHLVFDRVRHGHLHRLHVDTRPHVVIVCANRADLHLLLHLEQGGQVDRAAREQAHAVPVPPLVGLPARHGEGVHLPLAVVPTGFFKASHIKDLWFGVGRPLRRDIRAVCDASSTELHPVEPHLHGLGPASGDPPPSAHGHPRQPPGRDGHRRAAEGPGRVHPRVLPDVLRGRAHAPLRRAPPRRARVPDDVLRRLAPLAPLPLRDADGL
mmetsp:Transcript_98529/g.301470  ORF Transcript_98529/g.301470 Transcript_98529/m.301470 type:complete len:246 (+) Transcript_98529:1484-2221(+)